MPTPLRRQPAPALALPLVGGERLDLAAAQPQQFTLTLVDRGSLCRGGRARAPACWLERLDRESSASITTFWNRQDVHGSGWGVPRRCVPIFAERIRPFRPATHSSAAERSPRGLPLGPACSARWTVSHTVV